jgi:hypothetical protein
MNGVPRRLCWFFVFTAIALAMTGRALAQAQPKFYYWVVPASFYGDDQGKKESFVIEVNASTAAQIESLHGQHHPAGFSGHIAAGTAAYNKDYYSLNQRVWKWYVTSVDEVFDFTTTAFVQCQCANLIANPSEIDADPVKWISENGNQYTPKFYEIGPHIDPSKRDAMANVSNRGLTGSGERTLITGLIITGGEPRNVVVRAIGPSLSSSGIQQAAANPKLEVYRGVTKIATNADWKTDSRASELSQKYSSLTPTDEREAAMLLTLMPGTYTVQGTNEDGTEGIVLVEAYDVDTATVP